MIRGAALGAAAAAATFMWSQQQHIAYAISSSRIEYELEPLRRKFDELRERWKRDEDGWRKMPARAWPPFQPKENKINMLRDILKECKDQTPYSDSCTVYEFDLATSLLFNNIDAKEALRTYSSLAKRGHSQAMVAAGVMLTGGLGIDRDEALGMRYLDDAVRAGDPQGLYEIGTLLYTGDILEENESAAFEYFERAASQGHTCAEFMVADCLLEGSGVNRDGARAIPLLYKAAEKGHRSARRRLLNIIQGNWVASDGWCPNTNS
jgi:TPR repeat protein